MLRKEYWSDAALLSKGEVRREQRGQSLLVNAAYHLPQFESLDSLKSDPGFKLKFMLYKVHTFGEGKKADCFLY